MSGRARLWLVLLGGMLLGGTYGCTPPLGTVGAVLAKQGDGRLYVRAAPPGLAAERGGVEVGDEVLLIDGVEARDLSPDQVRRALRGQVGQPVRLTLIRDGEVVRVTLHRTAAQAR